MTSFAHLLRLLRGTWFRRLVGVRLTSQLGDGTFQVALASYALFSDDQPSPAAIASALAVILLPFSVLGPFVGVFLDRWSRRQVLVWANLSRVGIVAAVIAVVATGLPDPVFYAVVLVCLSVNRFLLAGLSAALPHTVTREDLVVANALTPTAGTLAFIAGLGLGGVVRAGLDSDVAVLATAAILYAAAGGLAARIPRDLLGPDFDPTRPAVREALGNVVTGLGDGLRHLGRRRQAAAGLATIASHRYWFGISSVMLILLYRGYFNAPDDPDAAFADLSRATLVGGAGFLLAVIVTPGMVERIGARRWILALLALASVTQVVPALRLTQTTLLVAVFVLGMVSQGIKICVDTLVQTQVEDAYRGRVFSLYDVLFNVAFVAAAATAAAVLPPNGRSPVTLVVVAAGYAATAVLYARASAVASAGHDDDRRTPRGPA